MGLKKPRSSAAAIHRRISKIAQAQSWRVPSYSTVYAILANLDPTIVTLSHEGAAAFRDRFELIHRHRTGAANAIWQKADPSWPVCGIPDGLYVDQGGDFTSNHLDQVAASLRFRIVYSTVARPQGRGKIERLFGTLNSELLPELAGHHADLQDPAAPRVGLPH
jgi:transposase InsO family protein